MHTKHVGLVVVLALVVGGGAIGVAVLDLPDSASSSETPSDGGESEPGESGGDSTTDDTSESDQTEEQSEEQSEDESETVEEAEEKEQQPQISVSNLRLADSVEEGEQLYAEVFLQNEEHERVTETVNLSLVNHEETVEKEVTLDSNSIRTVEFEPLDTTDREAGSYTLQAATVSNTTETTVEIYESLGTSAVEFKAYEIEASAGYELDSGVLTVYDTDGDEVETLDDWDRNDVRAGELRVDGLIEGAEYTAELSEPNDGSWPGEEVTFSPGESETVEFVAGYEFQGVDSNREVSKSLSPSDRHATYTYDSYIENTYGILNVYSIARQQAEELDDRFVSYLDHALPTGYLYFSNVGEETNTKMDIEGDDDDANPSDRWRRSFRAQAVAGVDQLTSENIEFIEETTLEGSKVYEEFMSDPAINDHDEQIAWIPELEIADNALEDPTTVHKFEVEIPPEIHEDAERGYMYIDPDNGYLVRAELPFEYNPNLGGDTRLIEYFDHEDVTEDDYEYLDIDPEDYEAGDVVDLEDILNR